MAYFPEWNAIQLHVPRTGGTTIYKTLHGREGSQSHIHWEKLKERYTIEVWNNAFKFATVRNPFDWLVSLYYQELRPMPTEMVYRSQSKRPIPGGPVSIGGYPHLLKRSFEDYIRYPTHLHQDAGLRYMSQSRTIGPEIDLIIKFENLQEGFDELCERIGRPKSTLDVVNPTLQRDKDYRGYYNAELIEIVTKTFYEDLKRFSYSYENYWNALCHKYNY
jgi:hypothetical protein